MGEASEVNNHSNPSINLELAWIRNIPIDIDPWAYEQVGKRNDGPFKDNYQYLRIEESGESVVDCSSFGLSSKDYYYSRFSSNKQMISEGLISKKVLLRESHAQRLARADQYYRKRGLLLHIVSGWRHPELQNIVKKEYAQKYGQERADRLFASVGRQVPPPHSTGAAFDVELRDINTKQKIDMDVFYENERIISLYWAEELMAYGKLDTKNSQAAMNRRILYHGLCTKGIIFERDDDFFVGHPGEYWHYGDGDVLSAYLKKEPYIRYNAVYLE